MDLEEKARKLLDSAVSDYDSVVTSSGWAELGAKDEVRGYQKTEGDRLFVKGEGFIKLTPDKIADYLWDLNNRKDYVEGLDSIKVHHEFTNLKVAHETIKLPWPLSPREIFYAMLKIKKEEDYLIIGRSIDFGLKESADNTRAELFIRAFHLKNVKNIATKMTYLNSGNPGGNVPAFVINQTVGRQAFMISKIRSLVIR